MVFISLLLPAHIFASPIFSDKWKKKKKVKRKMEERAWEQKLKQAIIQKGLFSGSMEGTVSLWLWGKKTSEKHPEHEN